MSKPKPTKYPKFPDSNWDASVKYAAAAALKKPNKAICIYCHHQALTEAALTHEDDCPSKGKVAY